MLQPMDSPPASRAPRLAASMMPGPPPVMTAKPASASRRPVSRAAADIGADSGGAGAGKRAAVLAGGGVHRVGLRRAGRAEDGHGGADLGQRIEAGDELAHDA